MSGRRYVLLGLARARAEWFRTVAQWTTTAALPAAFTKCVSVEELRAQLSSAQPFSAVLLDAGLPAVDRDLLALVRDAGCAPLVVADGRDGSDGRDWLALGATAVLPTELGRQHLLDALATHATMVEAATSAGPDPATHPVAAPAPWEGALAAVCGPGGTGASTVAMALAQGLAATASDGHRIVLADLCLRADQAMLHDAGDVFPGLQELVESHRSGRLEAERVRELTFAVGDRGYHLLLGLRRSRHWATLRPRAFDAALAGLRHAFGMVIADVDADFEAEEHGGSIDVEERCHMARAAALRADVVVAVGEPGVKGVHALVRLLTDLDELGVATERVLPVINRAPRAPHARVELAAALARLAGPVLGAGLAAPLFLPRRKVDEALRDGVGLPAPLPALLADAHRRLAGGLTPASRGEPAPTPVVPGTVGSWSEEAS